MTHVLLHGSETGLYSISICVYLQDVCSGEELPHPPRDIYRGEYTIRMRFGWYMEQRQLTGIIHVLYLREHSPTPTQPPRHTCDSEFHYLPPTFLLISHTCFLSLSGHSRRCPAFHEKCIMYQARPDQAKINHSQKTYLDFYGCVQSTVMALSALVSKSVLNT